MFLMSMSGLQEPVNMRHLQGLQLMQTEKNFGIFLDTRSITEIDNG